MTGKEHNTYDKINDSPFKFGIFEIDYLGLHGHIDVIRYLSDSKVDRIFAIGGKMANSNKEDNVFDLNNDF